MITSRRANHFTETMGLHYHGILRIKKLILIAEPRRLFVCCTKLCVCLDYELLTCSFHVLMLGLVAGSMRLNKVCNHAPCLIVAFQSQLLLVSSQR